MRKEFSQAVQELGASDKTVLLLTGDLGFKALENVAESIGSRFINIGVSEQNMISMAAALASEGLLPICYSIAPFAVFRPAEQIRLDVCLHNQNVKIVGNGGGYGYGIMGATHHAIEDIAVLSSFQHMVCYIPFCNEDVIGVFSSMINRVGPGYLRLGSGELPKHIKLPAYSHTRRIMRGDKVTIVALGPVALNVITALETIGNKQLADLFVISEVPLVKISSQLEQSIGKTGKLLVVEEHVSRGGLGEHLAEKLLELGLSPKYSHLVALGYPNGLYGSQKYHQGISHLDPSSIEKSIVELLND